MSKKFITLKCRSSRRLYLDDISKVYTFEKRKTPKLPRFYDSDEETSELGLQLMVKAYEETTCLSSSF